MTNSIISNVIVRPVTTSDNLALKQFVESVPDGGRVAFQPRYKVDDIEQASSLLRPGNRGFAAFLSGKPVGIIYAWAHRVMYGRQEYPAVLLNGLSVHPDYRQQGLATRLLQEALSWAIVISNNKVNISFPCGQDGRPQLEFRVQVGGAGIVVDNRNVPAGNNIPILSGLRFSGSGGPLLQVLGGGGTKVTCLVLSKS